MTRLIVYSILAFVLLTVLGSLLRLVGFSIVSVDVATIIVLHRALGERRAPYSREPGWRFVPAGLEADGVVLALLLGHLTDLLGGVGGAHVLALGVLYLTARAVSRQVSLLGPLSQGVLTMVASLGVGLVGLIARWTVGADIGAGIASALLGQALLTAVAAPPLMRLLRFLDAKLSRDPTERGTLQIGDLG